MVISLVGVLPVTEVSASNTANDLVSIAESQLGNGYSKYSKYPSAWCADFVSWCARQSGVTSIPSTASCKNQYDGMKNNGCKEVSNPQKGDIVFFYCTKCSGVSNKWCHVGIMINSTTSIDGNYGGKVAYDKSYSHYGSLGYKHSIGITKKYVRPNYETSSPNPPSNVRLEKNQSWYDIQDTIELYPKSDGATSYVMSVVKDGTRIIDCVGVNGSYKFAASQWGYGNYYAWITACNSAGCVDSQGIEFSVIGSPFYSDVWTSKPIYDIDDNVSIFVSTVFAKGQCIGIDKEGSGRVITKQCDSTYEISAKDLGVGKYSAYFTVYNGSGGVDTKRVKFIITSRANLGTEFYARIKNIAANKYLTNSNSNVTGKDLDCNRNQVWKFVRQSDGSYKLISVQDNGAIDITDYGNAGAGTNVQMNSNWDTTAQRFYIYDIDGSYYFKPVCTDMVLDMSQSTYNLEVWGAGFDWKPQQFDIIKIDSDDVGVHNYISKIVLPTLKDQGYTLNICSVCGDSYKDNYVSPLRETQLKYQLAKLANGTYAVRFVFAVDEEEAIAAKKASIYLTTKDGTNTKETSFNTAYRSIYAGGKLVSAGEGKVFLTAKYVNIPEEELNLLATLNFDGDIYKRNVQI